MSASPAAPAPPAPPASPAHLQAQVAALLASDTLGNRSALEGELAMLAGADRSWDAARLTAYLASLGGAARVCGRVFGDGELAFNCRDCQSDPTCVLCAGCFRASQHEGHDVSYHRAGVGGCCDCGDEEAWKPEGMCRAHGPRAPGDDGGGGGDDDPAGTMLPAVRANLAGTAAALGRCLQEMAVAVAGAYGRLDAGARPGETPAALAACTWALVVHNDDMHTVEEVTTAIMGAAAVPKSAARALTLDVDGKGDVPVLENRSLAEVLAGAGPLDARGLHFSVEPAWLRRAQARGVFVIEWLRAVAGCSNAAGRVVADALLSVTAVASTAQASFTSSGTGAQPLKCGAVPLAGMPPPRAGAPSRTPPHLDGAPEAALLRVHGVGGHAPQGLLDLVRYDIHQTHPIRQGLHGLFIALIRHGHFRAGLGAAFGVAYPELLMRWGRGQGAERCTVLELAVQLFTVPSVVTALVATRDLPLALPASLWRCLASMAGPQLPLDTRARLEAAAAAVGLEAVGAAGAPAPAWWHGLPVLPAPDSLLALGLCAETPAAASEQYNWAQLGPAPVVDTSIRNRLMHLRETTPRYLHPLSSLDYACRAPGFVNALLRDAPALTALVLALRMGQGMAPQVRATGVHVEFEKQDWQPALILANALVAYAHQILARATSTAALPSPPPATAAAAASSGSVPDGSLAASLAPADVARALQRTASLLLQWCLCNGMVSPGDRFLLATTPAAPGASPGGSFSFGATLHVPFDPAHGPGSLAVPAHRFLGALVLALASAGTSVLLPPLGSGDGGSSSSSSSSGAAVPTTLRGFTSVHALAAAAAGADEGAPAPPQPQPSPLLVALDTPALVCLGGGSSAGSGSGGLLSGAEHVQGARLRRMAALLGALQARDSTRKPGEQLVPPSAALEAAPDALLAAGLLEYPLRAYALACQFRARLWAHNGASIEEQAALYFSVSDSSATGRHFHDADVLTIQAALLVAARAAPPQLGGPRALLPLVLNKFGLREFFEAGGGARAVSELDAAARGSWANVHGGEPVRGVGAAKRLALLPDALRLLVYVCVELPVLALPQWTAGASSTGVTAALVPRQFVAPPDEEALPAQQPSTTASPWPWASSSSSTAGSAMATDDTAVAGEDGAGDGSDGDDAAMAGADRGDARDLEGLPHRKRHRGGRSPGPSDAAAGAAPPRGVDEAMLPVASAASSDVASDVAGDVAAPPSVAADPVPSDWVVLSTPAELVAASRGLALRRELVHALAAGPKRRSALSKTAAGVYDVTSRVDDSELSAALAAIADYREPAGAMEAGVYVLKEAVLLAEFDPLFVHLHRDKRADAVDVWANKRRATACGAAPAAPAADGLTAPPAPPPTLLRMLEAARPLSPQPPPSLPCYLPVRRALHTEGFAHVCRAVLAEAVAAADAPRDAPRAAATCGTPAALSTAVHALTVALHTLPPVPPTATAATSQTVRFLAALAASEPGLPPAATPASEPSNPSAADLAAAADHALDRSASPSPAPSPPPPPSRPSVIQLLYTLHRGSATPSPSGGGGGGHVTQDETLREGVAWLLHKLLGAHPACAAECTRVLGPDIESAAAAERAAAEGARKAELEVRRKAAQARAMAAMAERQASALSRYAAVGGAGDSEEGGGGGGGGAGGGDGCDVAMGGDGATSVAGAAAGSTARAPPPVLSALFGGLLGQPPGCSQPLLAPQDLVATGGGGTGGAWELLPPPTCILCSVAHSDDSRRLLEQRHQQQQQPPQQASGAAISAATVPVAEQQQPQQAPQPPPQHASSSSSSDDAAASELGPVCFIALVEGSSVLAAAGPDKHALRVALGRRFQWLGERVVADGVDQPVGDWVNSDEQASRTARSKLHEQYLRIKALAACIPSRPPAAQPEMFPPVLHPSLEATSTREGASRMSAVSLPVYPLTPFHPGYGLNASFCGHAAHVGCIASHIAAAATSFGPTGLGPDGLFGRGSEGEFQCPLCRSLSNTLLPCEAATSWPVANLLRGAHSAQPHVDGGCGAAGGGCPASSSASNTALAPDALAASRTLLAQLSQSAEQCGLLPRDSSAAPAVATVPRDAATCALFRSGLAIDISASLLPQPEDSGVAAAGGDPPAAADAAPESDNGGGGGGGGDRSSSMVVAKRRLAALLRLRRAAGFLPIGNDPAPSAIGALSSGAGGTSPTTTKGQFPGLAPLARALSNRAFHALVRPRLVDATIEKGAVTDLSAPDAEFSWHKGGHTPLEDVLSLLTTVSVTLRTADAEMAGAAGMFDGHTLSDKSYPDCEEEGDEERARRIASGTAELGRHTVGVGLAGWARHRAPLAALLGVARHAAALLAHPELAPLVAQEQERRAWLLTGDAGAKQAALSERDLEALVAPNAAWSKPGARLQAHGPAARAPLSGSFLSTAIMTGLQTALAGAGAPQLSVGVTPEVFGLGGGQLAPLLAEGLPDEVENEVMGGGGGVDMSGWPVDAEDEGGLDDEEGGEDEEEGDDEDEQDEEEDEDADEEDEEAAGGAAGDEVGGAGGAATDDDSDDVASTGSLPHLVSMGHDGDSDAASSAESLPPLEPIPATAHAAAQGAALLAQGTAGQPAAAVPPLVPAAGLGAAPLAPLLLGAGHPGVGSASVLLTGALPGALGGVPVGGLGGIFGGALGGVGLGGGGLVGAEAIAPLLQSLLPAQLSTQQAQALQAQLVQGLSQLLAGPGDGGGGAAPADLASLATPILSAIGGWTRSPGLATRGDRPLPPAMPAFYDERAVGSAAPWFPRVLPGAYDPVAHHPIRRELAHVLQYAALPPEPPSAPLPGCVPLARAALQGSAELVRNFLCVGAQPAGAWARYSSREHLQLPAYVRDMSPSAELPAWPQHHHDSVLHGDVLLHARTLRRAAQLRYNLSSAEAEAEAAFGASALGCNPSHLLLLGVAVAPTLAHAAHHACVCYAVALLQGVDAAATYARRACLLLASLAPVAPAAAPAASTASSGSASTSSSGPAAASGGGMTPAGAACASPLVDGFLGFVAGFGACLQHLLQTDEDAFARLQAAKCNEPELTSGDGSGLGTAGGGRRDEGRSAADAAALGGAYGDVCALLRRSAPVFTEEATNQSASLRSLVALASAHCDVLRLLAASPWCASRASAERLLAAAGSAPLPTIAHTFGREIVGRAGRSIAHNHAMRLRADVLPPLRPQLDRLCLVDLPHAYEDLYGALGAAKCATGCRKRPANAALCLVCGVLVCAGGDCCRVQSVGEATRHAAVCGAGTGVLLQLASTGVLLLRGGLAIDYGSPYADAHGEPDLGLKRGKPLFLSARRYAALGALWARGGDLAREVSRVRASADRVYRVNFY